MVAFVVLAESGYRTHKVVHAKAILFDWLSRWPDDRHKSNEVRPWIVSLRIL